MDTFSGGSHGSVLSPLLFLFHVSDVNTQLYSTTVRYFAYDTRLIKKTVSQKDSQIIQEYLGWVFD